MLNIGLIIAASVLVIYIVLGPLVILAIYAFFDRMAENAEAMGRSDLQKDKLPEDKDPALWSGRDAWLYLERQRRFSESGRTVGYKEL